MFSYSKFILFLLFASAAAYAGYRVYQYSTIDSAPTIELVDFSPERAYAGQAALHVKGSDGYKVARMTAALDGKSIADEKIGKSSFVKDLSIDTSKISDGMHVLTIELTSGSRAGKSTKIEVPFEVDNKPLHIAYAKNEHDARVAQGRTLHVQFQSNKELGKATAKAFSKEYPCFLESNRGYLYECFIPVDTEEAPKEYLLNIEIEDKTGKTAQLHSKFTVEAFPFKKQALRLEPAMIKKENEEAASEKEFEQEVEKLTKNSPHKKLWHGQFVMPLDFKDSKQITSEYGVIRATQERGLRQHKALDIYAMPKSVIWAPQDGVVVMKARYAHSGNTVIIDHGYGILSMFFHLETFAPIEVGETIKKGNPVGTLGKTGYATGYHLHWELRVGNVPVDPMEWTKSGF